MTLDSTDGSAQWFLQGGGEAGAAARAVDWERTPLGSPQGWPATLKTIVATMLRARQPMFLWWGQDLIQIYNNAYVPSFGQGKHPRAMGQRGWECWGEIWPIIGPQILNVMQRASSTWDEDALVPIFRNSRLEEVYWTYTYTPVFDEAGAVTGVLVICTETTNRVLAERRSTLLCALVAKVSHVSSFDSLIESALDVLKRAYLDIPFAAFLRRDEERGSWSVIGSVGLSDASCAVLCSNLPKPEHWVRWADVAGSPSGGESVNADDTVDSQGSGSYSALSVDLQVEPSEFAQSPIHEVYCAPLHPTDGDSRAFVVLGISSRLSQGAPYRRFFHQVVAQLRADSLRIIETARRAAVETERKNLLEHAPIATAFLVGPDHRFELANPLYRQMVGRPDLVGKTYLEAFPELKGTEAFAVLNHVYATGEAFATSEQLIAIDKGNGRTDDCYFRFNLEPVRDGQGQIYGMMAVAVEVTEQVVARLVLEKAHAERERLLLDLERASRAKDEFLAMLGHELRNPLSPILTALALMRIKAGGTSTREQDVIERQAKHLIRLVDDLLDVAKIARGKVELRRTVVDLCDVVTDAAETASYELEHGQHTLTIDVARGLFFCFGDRVRLSQVVSNLLTNSARYTPQGGSITVRAHKENNELVLSVKDNGVGIASDMLSTVFTLFEQGKRSSDRSQGGLGIGLALVKNLIFLHGGRVSAHSEGPGKGSEFVVRLPVVASAELRAPAEKQPTRRSEISRRVLLVDDNVDALEMLQVALEAVGHSVARASNALEALEVAANFAPEVAVLDIGLPVLDGYELSARMRELPACTACRFVALTGYGQASDRERSRASGFQEHMVKPVDVEKLLHVIAFGTEVMGQGSNDSAQS